MRTYRLILWFLACSLIAFGLLPFLVHTFLPLCVPNIQCLPNTQ